MDLSSIFIFKVVENNACLSIYRTNFVSENDALKWLDEYSKKTNTSWIVKNGVYNPQRLIFHKCFVCQHASRNKRVKDSERNTGCLSSIDIKVKKCNKATRNNDVFLKENPPLAGIVKMNIVHNHEVNTCGSLKLLRIDDVVRKQYISYFEDGLGISESIKQYENKHLLISESDLPEVAANARVNPTYNMVKNLFRMWRQEHFGTVMDNILKLKEKISYYDEQGITIETTSEGQHLWAILMVTPIMKRCQQLIYSREIIFVDSTCSVDATSSTLTIMLTASKAGAICMLIHEGQTEDSYMHAFSLLKNFNNKAFGEFEHPVAFMTDNSSAEKNALKLVWSKSRQLLCHFHVAQAEWRWLMSARNQIPADKRQTYMKEFKKVMYASSAEEFEENSNLLLNSDLKPNYKKRFDNFLQLKQEWGLCFRQDLITRGHNTNNYSEATMRIMKDIVLQRTKAFNSVALVDYCCSVWEHYSKIRLLNFASGRRDNSFFKLNILEKAISNFDVSSITTLDDIIFEVPSLTTQNLFYKVDSNLGLCSCPCGLQGAFCKHQYLINKNFKKILPNAPSLSAADKYALAKLALGDELKSEVSFFGGLKLETSNEFQNPEVSIVNKSSNSCMVSSSTSYSMEEGDIQENVRLLQNNLTRIQDLLPRTTSTNNNYLSQINKQLSKISTEQQAVYLLIESNSLFRRRKGELIKVQPTSISRRRMGVSRGCKRLNSGRPSLSKNKKIKRKHDLSVNVIKNKSNAILH